MTSGAGLINPLLEGVKYCQYCAKQAKRAIKKQKALFEKDFAFFKIIIIIIAGSEPPEAARLFSDCVNGGKFWASRA